MIGSKTSFITLPNDQFCMLANSDKDTTLSQMNHAMRIGSLKDYISMLSQLSNIVHIFLLHK
jgi:hypothetical protein